MTQDAHELRAVLRSDLKAAMKARDRDAVSALRTLIAALDNAEAVDGHDAAGPGTSGLIAGAAAGVGATEVARRELSADDVQGVLRAHLDEHLAEADRYDAHGQGEAADRLRREAVVLARYARPS